jgi:hypothetical protein
VKLTSFAIVAMTVITFYLILRYIKLLGDWVTNTQMPLLCKVIILSLSISFMSVYLLESNFTLKSKFFKNKLFSDI